MPREFGSEELFELDSSPNGGLLLFHASQTGRDTTSQIVVIWLIATVIGLCGLNHVVVGSIEVLAGLFAGQGVTVADYGRFLLWTTLGNALGGSFFVALIKFSHAKLQ